MLLLSGEALTLVHWDIKYTTSFYYKRYLKLQTSLQTSQLALS